MMTPSAGGSCLPQCPLVSVLIRSMDRDTLADALASVAAQTYDAIEVVVVNAGRQPHRPLGEHCGRFALRLVEPGGAGLARPAAANRAMAEARGDWLLFLDDDDLLDPDHISRLQAALAAAVDHQVAYAGVRLRNAAGQGSAVLDEPFDATRLWLANYLPIHAVMFARRLHAEGARFDEALPVYEDWDFWHQLARSHRFLHVPGVSATYRLIGDSGLSAGRDEALSHEARQAVYRKWLPQMDSAQLERLAAQAELSREAEAKLRAGQALADQSLRQLNADLARLHADMAQREAELGDARRQAQNLNELHAASVESERALQQQLDETRAYQQQLLGQIANTRQDYQRLEQGYRDVLASLSWRITRPLRTVRSAPAALRGGIGTLARTALRAAPVSPATRQRVKLKLATSRWGAPLLRWLAPPMPVASLVQGQASLSSGPSAAAPATPVLDKNAVRAEAEAELTAFLARGERLQFAPSAGVPKVSVITVLFNQAGLSLLCLQGLARSRAVSFETLIVDNASSDRVPQMLGCIEGVQVLTQSVNLGFLRAVNLAAGQARGEYLLLLNNDAVVEPDTLAHAVARLDSDPRIGAVGGPILLWDGRLQEAGSIIWRDGSCLGYGRGDSPDAGPYRFVRDVDYCSGAFLMLRRELFDAMGRFDDAFAPAYYEESDFCARLWEAGRPVVFDPKVRVKHFEFASDAGSGQAMVLQTRNRALFETRHVEFLSRQHASSPAAVLDARIRLPENTLRVLVIDDRVPLPSLGRGYPRAANLLQALDKAGAFVTHYPLLFPLEDWTAVYNALPERIEVMQGLGMAGLAQFLRERRGAYDMVLVSRPHNMEVVQAIRKQQPDVLGPARLVYDAEALFSLRDIARDAVLDAMPALAEQRRRVAEEMTLARGADAIVTVSELEAGHYREAGYAQVHVLGHAIEPCPGEPGFDERAGFLFVGALEADNSPNTDSMLWFVREVWPQVRAALGEGARLDIVGPCESTSVAALAGDSIKVWGRVDDIHAFYDRARVFVVPTRFAAGIPHKAHEAAAHGLPMVVSTLIANQLGWSDAAFAQASDARAFAQACIRLHSDAACWRDARQFALDAVARDCTVEAFDRTVQRILAVHESQAESRPPMPLPVA